MWEHKRNFTYAAFAATPSTLLAAFGFLNGFEAAPVLAAIAVGAFIVDLTLNYALDFYARQFR